jgi:hypothetical protein
MVVVSATNLTLNSHRQPRLLRSCFSLFSWLRSTCNHVTNSLDNELPTEEHLVALYNDTHRKFQQA